MKKTLMHLIMVMVVVVGMVTVNVPGNTVSAESKNELTVTGNPKARKVTGKVYKYLFTVNEKVQLKVKYGNTDVTKKAKYKSSNKKVMSITKTGKLNPKKKGSATITITYKGMTKKLKFYSHKHEWVPQYADITIYNWQCDCCGSYLYCPVDKTTVSDEAIQKHMANHSADEQSKWHYIKAYRTDKENPSDYFCPECGEYKSYYK